MTATISRFSPHLAPCGRMYDGERYLAEDQSGLVTEELQFSCGCAASREEFHDGSVHRRLVDHHGTVVVDEELRGE
jgi:hypothetical protein